MSVSNNPIFSIFSQFFYYLISFSNWLGNFVISGLWWVAQFFWWMCNFVGSLVLSLFGLVMGLLGKSKRKGLGKFAKNIQKKTSKHRAGVIGKLMSKPVRRRLLPGLAVVLLFLAGFAVYSSRQAPEAEAGWWNETWIYRRGIEIVNSGSEINDVRKVKVEVDTESLITNGKLQNDCADVRFTDNNGNIIRHFLDANNGDCNTSASHFYVELPKILTGEQIIYFYYGNQSASSSASTLFFAGTSLAEDLLSYWKMDEETGSLVNDSGTDNPGTATGASIEGGLINNARQFSASTDYVEATNRYDNLSALSVAFWIWRPNSSTIYYHLLGNNNNHAASSDGFRFLKRNSDTNNLQFRVSKGGILPIVSVNNLPTEEWAHVVGTFAGGEQLRLYINGSFVGSANTTITDTGVSGEPFRIHQNPSNEHGVPNTLIDEVMIYNRVISDAEIEQLFNAGTGISFGIPTFVPSTNPTINAEEVTPGPIAHWKFDEGTGTTAHDSSGQGNHGTISGATWQTSDQCISNSCLLFDGSSNITVSNPLHQDNLDQEWTVKAWVKLSGNTGGGTQYLLSSFNLGLRLNHGTANKSLLYLNSGTNDYYIYGTKDLKTDSWHHITFIFRNSDGLRKIYIDGEDDSSSGPNHTSTPSGISDTIYIGTDTVGFIDDVKIYPYARSAEQIKADYAAGLAGMSTPQGASATHGSYSPSWMSDGLVGYWKMDEASWNGTSGEVIDASGNNNHGTAVNGAIPGVGKFGNGGVFDGSSKYLTVPYSRTTTIQTETISAWIYRTGSGIGSFSGIVNIGSPTANPQSGINTDDTHQAVRCNGSYSPSSFTTDSTDLPLNTWTHVACIFDYNGEDLTISLHKNGEKITEVSQAVDSYQYSTNSIRTGVQKTDQSRYFNGSIDEVRIYNRALSPAEVKALYEWTPGPIAHYTFDSGDNNTLNDVSGYGNNGTWYGSTASRYTSGKYGNAGVFNGTNDYVEIGNPSIFNFSTENFSIGAWIKFSSGLGNHTIAGKYCDINSPGYWLRVNENKIVFRISDGGGSHKQVITNGTYNDNSWHHVFVSAERNGLAKIYINGTEVKTGDISSEAGSLGTGILSIGRAGTSYYYDGLIDDVRIYNYVRSQKQILEDMQGGPPSAASVGGGGQLHPIAHWRFDEGYGTTAHDSIGSNHGTFGAGDAAPAWTNEGKVGKALSFDGSDYINMGNDQSLDIINELSLSAWIKSGHTDNPGYIISKRTGSNYQFGLLKSSANAAQIVDGYGNFVSGTTNIIDDNWYHIVGTISGTTAKIYVNGEEENSETVTGLQSRPTIPVIIGARDLGTASLFSGLIDEVKIYNYALSPEEVKLDYNQGMSAVMGAMGTDDTGAPTQVASAQYCIPGDDSHCSPPVAEWLFNENQGTVARDTSGNGNDGALVNGPVWTTGRDGGGALEFNGGYVQLPSSLENLLDGKPEATMSMWVQLNSDQNSAGNAGLIQLSGFDNPNGNLYYYTDSSRDGGIWLDIFRTNRLFTGDWQPTFSGVKWHYLTVTTTPGSNGWKMYLNGILRYQTTGEATVSTNPSLFGGFRIGQNSGGRYLRGKIDQVRIYDYARTPAQIAWDYNRGAPVGRWRFDECQGTTAHDVSGNENHGAINIGATGSQTSAGTCTSGNSAHAWYNGREGRINSALSFDGVDDFINAGNQTGNFSSSGTISAWVQTDRDFPSNDTSSKHRGIISKTSSGSSAGISYYVDWYGTNSSRTLRARIGDGTSSSQGFAISNFSFNQGWNHLVYSWSGVQHNLYINNQPQTPVNQTINAQILTDTPLRIGSAFSDTNSWDGLIDDVRIYNYALTDEQIKLLYNDGAAIKFGN